jgi:ectoine hydroxylase-related dioxygenase (phytanoyl-CoA dioxygenase family)
MGYWLPLIDVNTENGCIWVLPGTHKSKLYSIFKVIDGKPHYEFDALLIINRKIVFLLR